MNRGLVLVTGANGFLGTNLTRVLIDLGKDVRAFVRSGSDLRSLPRSNNLKVFEGDLRDQHSIKQAVLDCDEIYHLAADYRFWALNPKEIYENNVEGTRNLLIAAFQSKAKKVVYTSTVGTIGLADQSRPANEESPLDPNQMSNHYKRSKFQAEKIALEYAQQGLPIVIVNPSTPIGPWDHKPTPTGKIIVDFVLGKIPAFVKTGLNFIHVKDVARGHILAAEKGRIGNRYILGHQNLSMKDFLEVLAQLTGKPAPKVCIPYSMAWMTGLLSTTYSNWISKKSPAVPLEAVSMSRYFMYFDSSKAVTELGLPQTPVSLAVAESLEWFFKHGYLGSNFDASFMNHEIKSQLSN